jgi:hypothetical protein
MHQSCPQFDRFVLRLPFHLNYHPPGPGNLVVVEDELHALTATDRDFGVDRRIGRQLA